MEYITSEIIKRATGVACVMRAVACVGVAVTDVGKSMLSFIDDAKYVGLVNSNESIAAIFVTKDIERELRSGIDKIVVDDPRWCFFSLVNYLANSKKRERSKISNKAVIAEGATIAPFGVVIEDNVVVEPGVIVMQDVTIREGVVVRAGAVLGVDGFEHKKTSKGLLTVVHDGELVVERNAEIGPNNTIIKGFSYRATIVGEDTKLDALVHYAHGVQSGKRCLIAANAMIAGHVTLGDDVWVGPSASISNRINVGDGAFITIGSVVVRDVGNGQKVTGNFAIPHATFIRNLKNQVR